MIIMMEITMIVKAIIEMIIMVKSLFSTVRAQQN